MKKNIFIFLIFFGFSYSLSSQENEKCYEVFREYGLSRFKSSAYKKAIYNFEAAKECPDRPADAGVISFILRAKKCLEAQGQANLLYRKGNYKEAKIYFEKIVSINPDDAIAKHKLDKCKTILNELPSVSSKPISKSRPVETKKTIKKAHAIPTSLGLTLVQVQGGAFTMGSDEYSDESPAGKVELDDFFISKHEITNQQYANFLNSYGSTRAKKGKYTGMALIHLKGAYENLKCRIFYNKKENIFSVEKGFEDHPVTYVSWYGAYYYATFYNYRLPTEAEWEFAARGGLQTKNYKFSGSNDADDIAWYKSNNRSSNPKTYKVGTKEPNELGVFDMSGNVWEWCSDWYDFDYSKRKAKNPDGAEVGTHRVLRGGSWGFNSNYLRTTNRLKNIPETESAIIGFRIVAEVKNK